MSWEMTEVCKRGPELAESGQLKGARMASAGTDIGFPGGFQAVDVEGVYL
jgi:hypothetical protein